MLHQDTKSLENEACKDKREFAKGIFSTQLKGHTRMSSVKVLII